MLARQPQQPFAGAVDRNLLGHDLRPRQREVRVERGVQILRHAGHLLEARGAAHIEPVPDLLHAHLALRRRHADAGQAPRRARRATARPATASPAARSARAAPSRRSPRTAASARRSIQVDRVRSAVSAGDVLALAGCVAQIGVRGQTSIQRRRRPRARLISAARSAPSRRPARAPWRPRSCR